jgi:hypothetical protein
MKVLHILLWSIRVDRPNIVKIVVEIEDGMGASQAKSSPSGLNLALAEVESKVTKVMEQLTNGWSPGPSGRGASSAEAEVDPLGHLREVLKMLDDIKKSPPLSPDKQKSKEVVARVRVCPVNGVTVASTSLA